MSENGKNNGVGGKNNAAGSLGDKRQDDSVAVWRYAALGTQFAFTVAAGVLVGWWLDSKYGWSPWGMVGFGSLGIAAAFYHFLKEVSADE